MPNGDGNDPYKNMKIFQPKVDELCAEILEVALSHYRMVNV